MQEQDRWNSTQKSSPLEASKLTLKPVKPVCSIVRERRMTGDYMRKIGTRSRRTF